MNEALLQEVKKIFPEADYVIDLYDLSLVWVGPKTLDISGYTEQEFLNLRTLDLINKDKTSEQDYRKIVAERMVNKEGMDTVHFLSKQGEKIQVDVKYKVFEFQNGWYVAGEMVKSFVE